jgi:DNA replication and repair protein RecF
MILQEIEYEGFRNLADARISFCSGLNIFTGENGAGKTNILESIFFLAYGTSFRTTEDRNIIKLNHPYVRVEGISRGYDAVVFYNGEKRFTINGVKKDKLSEYIGWLPVVVMTLNDIWLIRGAPIKRRNYLDWLLIKLYPDYRDILSEYRNILRQRNRLLQQGERNKTLLRIYNEQFIHWANMIYEKRGQIIPGISEKLSLISREFGIENISFEYQSSCSGLQLTYETLERVEQIEFDKAETVVGPHRDDFVIKINGYPARQFCSDGECRLLVLGLRLIEAECIKQKMGESPVFLIDEAVADLDRLHQKNFFELLKGQIFYATVHNEMDINQYEKKKFVIKRGYLASS